MSVSFPNLDAQFFGQIPTKPGVYFMFDKQGRILYIGKAKNLRNRLRSYRSAPGNPHAPEHIRKLVPRVERIVWELHSSERQALYREAELLHAVRPPFNIAGTWEVNYLFIGLRFGESPSGKPGYVRASFELGDDPTCVGGYGGRLYGCFKSRRRIKDGYTALLRLIYAATFTKPRFAYPAVMTREAPPYRYQLTLPSEWQAVLHDFLNGKNRKFIALLMDRLLSNEQLPRFMRASIQDDLALLSEFYRRGPRATRRLKSLAGVQRREFRSEEMDEILKKSCPVMK